MAFVKFNRLRTWVNLYLFLFFSFSNYFPPSHVSRWSDLINWCPTAMDFHSNTCEVQPCSWTDYCSQLSYSFSWAELCCVVMWCDVVVVHECVVVHTSSMQWQTLSCVLWVGLWSRGIIQLIWVISDASIQFVGVVCCVVEMWLPSKASRNVVHELLCYVSWHAAQAMRTSHSTSILLNSTLFI